MYLQNLLKEKAVLFVPCESYIFFCLKLVWFQNTDSSLTSRPAICNVSFKRVALIGTSIFSTKYLRNKVSGCKKKTLTTSLLVKCKPFFFKEI